MYVVLLGPPGAGKGTQAKLLQKECSLTHISTGDLLRKEVQDGSELGRKAKTYMEKGELVPDAVILGMVGNALKRYDKILFDGFPRNLEQARALEQLVRQAGKEIHQVVNIGADDETIIRRLTSRRVCPACGRVYNILTQPSAKGNVCEDDDTPLIQRKDDKEDVIRNRLDVYREQTEPLIAFYRQKNKLLNMDGGKAVMDLFKEIKGCLCT